MKQPDWVRFVHPVSAVVGRNVKLVQLSFAQPGDKPLPDSGTTARVEGVRRVTPTVEIARHRDLASSWRPNAKGNAGLAIGIYKMSSQLVVNAVVTALVVQVEVLVGEQAEIVSWWSCGRHPLRFLV
jgi:hypothetical protein